MREPKRSLVSELGPVHLIGIGGAGMSALAKVLLARGVRVSGSDGRIADETTTVSASPRLAAS